MARMVNTHDYEGQQRETFDTFTELAKAGAVLPETSVVEFYLLAEGDEADWAACEKAMHALGHTTERDREGDTLIVATKGPLRIAPEVIWPVEKAITDAALRHDFLPDGWEFGFD